MSQIILSFTQCSFGLNNLIAGSTEEFLFVPELEACMSYLITPFKWYECKGAGCTAQPSICVQFSVL